MILLEWPPNTSRYPLNKTILYWLHFSVDTEAALLQQLLILKEKLLWGKSFLLHRWGWSANNTFPGPRLTQLLPQGNAAAARGSGKWLWHSRQGFFSAPGWFLICISEVFSYGEVCSDDAIPMIQDVSVPTVSPVLCSAVSMRVVQSWNDCL